MILNVFSAGSAPPSTIAEAAQAYGGCVFVVDPDDAAAVALLPILEELGEVITANTLEACVCALGGRRPWGVVSFADRGIRLSSELSRHFGLPGLSTQAAEWFSDKVAQRARLNECGIGRVSAAPMVGGVFPPGVPLPAVVKPREGAGSQDTAFVHTMDEFSALMAQLDTERPYIVEQYIEGVDTQFGPWRTDLVTVESATDVHGAIRHLGVSLRLPLVHPARETGFIFPIECRTELAEALLDDTEKAIEALGFTAGITHTEFKIGRYGPVIIEVNGRLAGGLHRLMPKAGTVEPVGLAVALAVGEPLTVAFPKPTTHAMHYYAQPPYGAVAVSDLPAPKTVRAVSGVFGVNLATRPGSPIHWRQGSSGRIYDIWVEAETLAELGQRKTALDELLEKTVQWEFES